MPTCPSCGGSEAALIAPGYRRRWLVPGARHDRGAITRLDPARVRRHAPLRADLQRNAGVRRPAQGVRRLLRRLGNRDKIAAGWFCILLGGFFYLWFLAALRQALRRLDPDGFLTNVATLGGVVYAALTLTGASLVTGIDTMGDDTFRDQVFPDIIHAAGDGGYVIHSAGGAGAGAMIIAASLAAARARAVPGWLGWIGVVFGVLGILSIFFLPQFLIALWIVVAGVLLFVGARRTAPPAATPERPPAA